MTTSNVGLMPDQIAKLRCLLSFVEQELDQAEADALLNRDDGSLAFYRDTYEGTMVLRDILNENGGY